MRFSPLLLLLVGCGFEVPDIPDAPAPSNVLAGSIVANGVEVPTDVSVLVFDARDPGPPLGTGSPITFATVPARAFTGSGAGIQSAPFTVTGLPDGDWLLQAIMDTDGNFNPFDSSVAGATCGDIVGRHVTDLVTGNPAPLHVEGGQLLDHVTIALGTVVPLQRPAFELPAAALVNRASSLDPTTPQLFALEATAVHTAFAEDFPLDLQGPCVGLEPVPGLCDPAQLDLCDTAFWVHVVDEDADGFPDLRPDYPPEAGIPTVWPRVFLKYLGTPIVEGGTVVGFDAPPDEAWAAEAFPFAAELGAFFAGLIPQPLPFGTLVPVHSLSVTWAPVAVHEHAGGALTDALGVSYDIVDLRAEGADAIPAGAWSITVVSEIGQTWEIPNALAVVNVSTQPGVFDPAGQAGVLILE